MRREGIRRSLVPLISLGRTGPSFSLLDLQRVCVRRVRRREGALICTAS